MSSGVLRRLAVAVVLGGALLPTGARGADTAMKRKAAPPQKKEELAPPPTDHARAFFLIRASIQAGARDFSYVDRLTPTLRPYSIPATPLVSLDAELYPLAKTRVPVLDDFGITFDYATAFALASADGAGTAVNTSWSAIDVGARERIPLGRNVLAGLHGGYGEVSYAFDDTLGPRAQLPSVRYRFARVGADLRVALGNVALSLAASYLGVLSTGLVGTYFPRATAAGLEARAGASLAVTRGVEVSIDAIYTRFFYSLHPEPGDTYVAGGALDQMARASLGVAYFF